MTYPRAEAARAPVNHGRAETGLRSACWRCGYRQTRYPLQLRGSRMLTPPAIVLYWVLVVALAVTTSVLLSLAIDQADALFASSMPLQRPIPG